MADIKKTILDIFFVLSVEGEPGSTPEGTPHAPEKQKRRRRSRKSKLEESFPSYLQVCT